MMRLLTTLSLVAGLTTAPTTTPATAVIQPAESANASAEIRREELMSALRSGGYTIVLRHARTDRTVMEDPQNIPAERYRQRNLNDQGVADARLMRVVLEKYQIPIGEILSSPMYRTRETAEYAAGTPTTTMALRVFPATPEQKGLLAVAPRPGTNRLLVTHHFVIELHVPGIRPGDVGESEAAVVRPTGDGNVELVGRVSIADWQALAGTAASASSAASTTAGRAPAGHGPAYAPGTAAPVGHGVGAAADVTLPHSDVGHLAQTYLAAFNSGDAEKMRAFIDASMAANANRPTAARVESYKQLFEDHGPLTVTAVESSAAEQVVLAVRSKRGAVQMTVRKSDEQAGRLASVSFAFEQGRAP